MNEKQPAGALPDAEFLAKRLARVAKLAGVAMPEGFTDEQVAEVAGTILGQIAFQLERGQQVAAPECGMCNDTGVVGFPPDQYETCPDCIKAAAKAPSVKIDEIRALLEETYGFVSTSPRGQENINAALNLLDEIEAVTAPAQCPICSEGHLLSAHVCNKCESIVGTSEDARRNARAVLAPQQAQASTKEGDNA